MSIFSKQKTSMSDSELSSIICNGIMFEVLDEVENKLVRQLVEDFEREARAIVKKELEKVTIESVGTSLDLAFDHVHVRFDYNERTA